MFDFDPDLFKNIISKLPSGDSGAAGQLGGALGLMGGQEQPGLTPKNVMNPGDPLQEGASNPGSWATTLQGGSGNDAPFQAVNTAGFGDAFKSNLKAGADDMGKKMAEATQGMAGGNQAPPPSGGAPNPQAAQASQTQNIASGLQGMQGMMERPGMPGGMSAGAQGPFQHSVSAAGSTPDEMRRRKIFG